MQPIRDRAKTSMLYWSLSGCRSNLRAHRKTSTNAGWWFQTFFMFHNMWDVILPSDFHIFQRGRYTTNQNVLPQFFLGWCLTDVFPWWFVELWTFEHWSRVLWSTHLNHLNPIVSILCISFCQECLCSLDWTNLDWTKFRIIQLSNFFLLSEINTMKYLG